MRAPDSAPGHQADEVSLPAGIVAAVASRPADSLLIERGMRGAATGDSWLRRLPRDVADLCTDWGLVPDGSPRHGVCALVVPVVGEAGPAALKITWPHLEAATEHLALRHWNGHGAVRLLRADPPRWAMLLERLDADRDLHGIPIDDACHTIGDLLRQLRIPAPATVPRLTAYAARQAHDFAEVLRAGTTPVPRRFIDQARALADDFAREPTTQGWLLHTDLHFANVLAGVREDEPTWLAIDPKPMAGDSAFEIGPLLWNRTTELGTGSQIRWSLRRRMELACEAAEIDEDRARAWTIVREMDNALDLAADPTATTRVGLAVAIIKAMQP